MTDSSRRDFIRTLAVATAAAARPLPAFAQEVRVRTIAGTGVAGYEMEGSGGLVATQTPVNNPYGIVVGPDGALYFCEVDTGRTRRMDLRTGRLTT
ncbi:MAG: twin-arginine translocation signal domain-containing protein, partial [Gemmatimonadetes bacterium]|nr:twin-arginine translocation signal domain-containing protein [Gemmatimonadota bacterium]